MGVWQVKTVLRCDIKIQTTAHALVCADDLVASATEGDAGSLRQRDSVQVEKQLQQRRVQHRAALSRLRKQWAAVHDSKVASRAVREAAQERAALEARARREALRAQQQQAVQQESRQHEQEEAVQRVSIGYIAFLNYLFLNYYGKSTAIVQIPVCCSALLLLFSF